MKKISYEDVCVEAAAHGLTIVTPKGEFRGTQNALQVKCRCGRVTKKWISNIRRGSGCHKCGHKRFEV